jgi:predicted ArsR family transcriptional regulator
VTKKHIKSRELLERANQNSTKLAVFNAIRKYGSVTTSDIETRVQTSRPTLLRYLEELTKEELIVGNGQTKFTMGRPANLYSVNASAAYALGVDFGAPDLTFAIVDLAKKIIAKGRYAPLSRKLPWRWQIR